MPVLDASALENDSEGLTSLSAVLHVLGDTRPEPRAEALKPMTSVRAQDPAELVPIPTRRSRDPVKRQAFSSVPRTAEASVSGRERSEAK
jgi:hypothetical protein